MKLHTDFTQRIVVRLDDVPWTDSPQTGVRRRMLERDGEEIARATSVVQFAPHSAFPRHTHDAGEEYLVLQGVFADEAGTYPAGTYVRNPAGTCHAPRIEDGCTIFVKLRQIHPDDRAQVVVATREASPSPTSIPGVARIELHRYRSEEVAVEEWAPGTSAPPHQHPGGEEVLVLRGEWQDEQADYPAGTWVRLPPGSRHQPRSPNGCRLWVKRGHLPGLDV